MLIAHISDLHIFRSPGQGEYNLKRVLGSINYRFFRGRGQSERIARESLEKLAAHPPDLVLLTGDMTQLGLDAEFDAAEALLSILTRKNIPVIAIPGNHDMYGYARRERLNALISSLAPGIDRGEDGIIRFAGVELLPLSQSVPTRLPFISSGRQNRDELTRAEAGWKNRSDRVMRLVCGHYPAIDSRSGRFSFFRGLRNAASLMEFCERCGVAAYFCGHEHLRFTAPLPGGCTQYAAPALSAVHAGDEAWVSVYECGPDLRRPREINVSRKSIPAG